MDETTKRELDALLTLIKDTANRCVKVSRLFRKSTEETIASAASVPTSNPQEILKYERGLAIESIKSSYKYLDISEYLRSLSDYYDTLNQYFTRVMPVHWFLLYITHRFHLSNWRSNNKAILASSSNVLSLKEIDRYLFKYLCEYDYNGIGYVKEIMSFASKAIDDRIPADIADIYFHSDHPEDDSKRLNEIKELLGALPGQKGVALAEIFDCIIYLTESEPYRLLNPSLNFFISDVYLDISDAGFSSDYRIIESKKPAILPRQFKTVYDWLAGIKEEYVINRGIIDEGVCIYIDDLLGIEHTHRDATNTTSRKSLAYRWLNEKYALMPDETLIKIIKGLWPDLMREVDVLKWTPRQRSNKTFEKTKTILASCILFHAAERAGIAKVAKQEEDEVAGIFEEYYEEQKAELVSTYGSSNRRDAGVSSSERRWNNLLTPGFIDTLKACNVIEFGRTGTQKYLLLLHKYIWKKAQDKSNLAEIELFAKTLKTKLGQQLGLICYDNQKGLRKIIMDWEKRLPAQFDVAF